MDIDEQFPLLKMEEASSSDISSSEFSASANCANIDRQRGILWIGFRPKKKTEQKKIHTTVSQLHDMSSLLVRLSSTACCVRSMLAVIIGALNVLSSVQA